MKEINNYSTEIHSKYYTDQKGIAVLIKRLEYIKLSNIGINKLNLGIVKLTPAEVDDKYYRHLVKGKSLTWNNTK